MYQYPTSTTIMAPFNHEKTAVELTKTYNQMDSETPDIVPTGHGSETLRTNIYELHPSNKTIPIFSLPTPFKTSVQKDDDKMSICVDVRGVTRSTPSGDVVITNPTDYAFLMDLALLSQHWVNEEMISGIAITNKTLLTKLFTRWLGGSLIVRLNIEQSLQVRVNIIVAYYWICLTSGANDVRQDTAKMRMTARGIGDAVGAQSTYVIEVLESLEPMSSIDDLIGQLIDHSGSSRFNSMTAGFVFTLVQYSWYGANPIQVCSTALEYPPIFMGMVYHAATKDGYSKTAIGRLIKDVPRSDLGGFIKAYDYEIYK